MKHSLLRSLRREIIQKIFLVLFFSLFSLKAICQENSEKTKSSLSLNPKISFVDYNHNDSISREEAKIIFLNYLSNPARKDSSDLITDIEDMVIDLIGHLENINCSSIKKTSASKRFIELYFTDKYHAEMH